MVSGKYDLVILAAGMGSRFGGLKQVQPVGPAGELIIEYSIFDALRAGFSRLVLVIRKDIEAEFRATVGKRLESRIEVQYVFQEVGAVGASLLANSESRASSLPQDTNPSGLLHQGFEGQGGRVPPPPRTKPWGTGQAVLVARNAVRGPFAVINADDFYGASGYAALAGHFARTAALAKPGCALVAYPLKQTLSEFGAVSRGLCTTDASGRLLRITEVARIAKTAHGAKYTEADGRVHLLGGEETVSMNFWGFTPAVFPPLERLFTGFLAKNANDPKTEFYLPTAMSTLIERRETEISPLRSEDAWFGLTYREDVERSRQALAALVAAGKYPSPLWG